jgi:hypothetical protein
MTIFKVSFRGRAISAFSRGALMLMLLAGFLLAGCTTPPTVSQGTGAPNLSKPGDAASARLANVHGTVEVKTNGGQWTPFQSGKTLKSGQQLRTSALSNATLVFYDGSWLYLGAEAEIKLDALNARTSGARIVQITQVSGESRHEVAQSDDPDSRYEVNTPTGNGSATATEFTVLVLPDQLTQFWVESGSVAVNNMDVTVMVLAGQTTSILSQEPPFEPEFRISGEGQVMQIDMESVISPKSAPNAQGNQNEKISLCHATGSTTNPYIAITVARQGATHGHESHAGDIIPVPADGCPVSAPAASTSWNIAGQTFTSAAGMVVFGNPQPGDWVSFEGRQFENGSRFVDRIVLLSHSSENQFTFTGKVEAIGDMTWSISGRTVQVNNLTMIEAGLKPGDNVQVSGNRAEDGTFWATSLNLSQGAGANFQFAGILTDIGGDTWVISGVKVSVGPNTMFYGDFVVGNPVAVTGVVQENGDWLATTINLVTPAGYRFEFTGVVENLNPWTVAGVSFDTADWTEMDAGIAVGTKVRVAGIVSADGVWIAERIEQLDTEHATSFAFFGPVLSLTPWNVGGISLTVDERTTIKGEIVLGEMVKVSGWILTDGAWLATEIKHTGLHLGQGCFTVSGVVQSINGDQILLTDGQTLVLTEGVVVDGEILPASLVRYQLCVDAQGQNTLVSIRVVYQLEYLPQDGKAVICHIPPGNSGNRHTIEVSQSDVPAHLGHGDTEGPCASEKMDKQPKQKK